jgi:hypothetical protein
MMKTFHILMIAALPLAFTGCLKTEKPSESTALPASLALTGTVLDSTGASAANVAVYVENSDQPIALSDASGTYSINLDDESLVLLQGKDRLGSQSFRLYFEDDKGQMGVSTPVNFGDRGDRSVEAVTLGAPSTVEGKVMLKAEGRKVEPGAAVEVRIGRARATTSTDGAFKVEGVPAGALPLSASAPKYAAAVKDLVLENSETRKLEHPLVLFPETGVAGAIFLDETIPASDFILQGHPYMRAFRPAWSKATGYFRYSSDPGVLTSLPWRELVERFDYDFPKDGGNVLYFQFCDETQQLVTDIQSLAVVLDLFEGTKGVVIEDGSGRISRRDAVLHFDVPLAAYRMRIAENTEQLQIKPWMTPTADMNYVFELYTNPATGQLEGFGQRTIYVQYMDAIGLLSPVYFASVIVDLFPAQTEPVFLLDGGAATTQNRIVRADIKIVPPYATEMRLWEVHSSSGSSIFGGGSSGRETSNIWLQVQPYIFYTFHEPGMKTLYLQFRGPDQVVSPVYQQTIRVDPFPPTPAGFLINGGAPTTEIPYVTLTLNPPPTAVAFKVTETTGNNNGGILGNNSTEDFINLVPNFPYALSGAGEHTLYVQYKTLDGDESNLYSQVINFTPTAQSGTFDINNGASVTADPVLNITNIVAPPTAAFMNISWGAPPSSNASDWQYITATVPYRVYSPGIQTIFITFKTYDGITSPAIQRSIIYDPFPLNALGVQINGTDATTTDDDVTLTFWAPSTVVKMRVANDINAVEMQPWQPFSYSLPHTIDSATGPQKVYVQFQTLNGDISPVYFDTITKL